MVQPIEAQLPPKEGRAIPLFGGEALPDGLSPGWMLLVGALAFGVLTVDYGFNQGPKIGFWVHGLEVLLSVVVLYSVMAGLGVFALASFDPAIPLQDQAFEVISALSTVGLSTGITAELSTGSKVVLCGLMFVGRVGPLALVLSMFRGTPNVRYQYPEEDLGESQGIPTVDVLVAAIGENFEAQVLVLVHAKKNYFELAEGFSLVEVQAPPKVVGKSLRELDLATFMGDNS